MSISTLSAPVQSPAHPAPTHAGDDELLRFLVTEYRTCAETGLPVTVEDAVVIEAEDLSTGKRATKLLCSAAFESVWLPRLAGMPFLPDIRVTVHDGRELAGARR
jgi:hypothetical protein